MQWSITLVTPIPSTIPAASVVSFMRDHAKNARLNPLIADISVSNPTQDLVSMLQHMPSKLPPSVSSPAHVDAEKVQGLNITDKIPMWGTVLYRAAFNDEMEDGMDAVVITTAFNVKLWQRWRVVSDDDGGMVLREDAVVDAFALLMPMVTRNYRKAHEELHKKMMKESQL